jgi:C4-dicarboxylate transporter DctM subunit
MSAKLYRAAGTLSGVALLIVALAITADVVLRWALSQPIRGLFELSELTFAGIMALAFAHANGQRSHVTLDLTGNLIGRTAGLQLLGNLLTTLAFVVFTWFLWEYAVAKAGYGETTLVLGLPLAPFWYAIAGLMAVSLLAQLAVTLEDLGKLLGLPGTEIRQHAVPALAMLAISLAIFLTLAWVGEDSSPLTKLALGFAGLYVLALTRVPLGVALAVSGLIATYLLLGWRPASLTLSNSLTSSLANADLAALPLFLLMGNLAVAAGFADDIFEAASALFGRLRGGHAIATVIGCAGFGAISGSSIATTATIGKAAFREMKVRNYAMTLSTGSIAAGGTLGALIPPSIVLIIYCVIAEQSIADAFAAALIPGLLATFLYVVAIMIYVRIVPGQAPLTDTTQRFSLTAALRRAWRPGALFAAVLGGLYGGLFTAQEAAAVGAGFAFLFWLASGSASFSGLIEATRDAVSGSAVLYLILIGANAFGSFVNLSGAPTAILSAIDPAVMPAWLVLLILVVMYLILGSVFDTVAALVITLPFVIPIIIALDGNLIWWGIVTLSLVEIGMITPPIGMNVFVLKGMLGDQVKIGTIFRGIVPFLIADMLRLLLLISFPSITLFIINII